MNVILPYRQLNGTSIHDDKVMGGIERFAQLVYNNLGKIHNVIPVEITDSDQRKRRTTQKVVRAVREYDGDVVLSNYDNETLTSRIQEQIDIPIAWFCHNLGTSISKVKMVQVMPEFIRSGGSVFMVTEYQHRTWISLSERINGLDTEIPVSGYIPSSCCSGSEPFYPTEKEHDAIVVARCDKSKDPFLLSRKVDGTGIRSTVVTSMYKDNKNLDYLNRNRHWADQKDHSVFWSIPHHEVMDHIARSKVLVSTHPDESFGITALESLSCGVPIILLTKPSMSHASEEIPASSDHFIKLRKSCKEAEFVEAYNHLAGITPTQRQSIRDKTQEKHSVDRWVTTLESHLYSTVEKYNRVKGQENGKSTLEGFI